MFAPRNQRSFSRNDISFLENIFPYSLNLRKLDASSGL